MEFFSPISSKLSVSSVSIIKLHALFSTFEKPRIRLKMSCGIIWFPCSDRADDIQRSLGCCWRVSVSGFRNVIWLYWEGQGKIRLVASRSRLSDVSFLWTGCMFLNWLEEKFPLRDYLVIWSKQLDRSVFYRFKNSLYKSSRAHPCLSFHIDFAQSNSHFLFAGTTGESWRVKTSICGIELLQVLPSCE